MVQKVANVRIEGYFRAMWKKVSELTDLVDGMMQQGNRLLL